MSRLSYLISISVTLLCVAGPAAGQYVEFVPPNDPTGSVFTTNSNDGWSSGRGVVFRMLQNVTVESLGVFHDLSGITLEYELAQVVTTSGNVTSGQTVLRSGQSIVTTNGLEWIDFAIQPVTLSAGSSYHIEFTFAGAANQNFFYNNANVTFTQGDFELIDGTQGGGSGNSVMPALRVLPGGQVPTIKTLGLLALMVLLGVAGIVAFRRSGSAVS